MAACHAQARTPSGTEMISKTMTAGAFHGHAYTRAQTSVPHSMRQQIEQA